MNLVKKLLMIVGVIVLLFIAAGLFLPVFIDVNDYKSKIEQLVEDNIGRKLNLKGDLELKTFPFLRVKTGELSLANPSGFPRQNMLEIKSAEIGIRLLPLIFKKVEAGTIKFDSPVINLTKKTNGQANWEFDSDQPKQEQDNSSTDSSATLAAFALQGFEISNAQVNFADLSSDTLVNIHDLNLKTGSIIPGTAFPVELTTSVAGSMLSEAIESTINTEMTIDSALENVFINQLKVDISHSESKFGINTAEIAYQISKNRLMMQALELKDLSDPQTEASMDIENIDVDLSTMIAKSGQTSADFISDALNANLKLPGLEFDINKSTALIQDTTVTVNNQDVNAQLNLPQSQLDLNSNDISLDNLSAQYSYSNLNGSLIIPRISLNKQTMEFTAKSIETEIGKSRLQANLDGGMSPLVVNFTLNTEGLNLKEILKSIDTDLNTANPEALTALALKLSGRFEENGLSIDPITGKLDTTTIDGSATISDFNSPSYQLALNLGDLSIDDYLPPVTTTDSVSAASSAGTAAGTPVALSQFDVTAQITANRIISNSNNIALENLALNLAPENEKSTISFKSQVSGAALPEPVQLNLKTLANLNTAKNNVELSSTQISAKGKTITAGLDIPALIAPLSAERINVENIKVNFSNLLAKTQLTIPDFSYDAVKSSVVIKNVNGNGTFNDINASIILPNLSVALDSQRLKLNELALDLSGSKPVGRLSIPTLDVNITNKSLGPTNIIFEGQDGRAQVNLKPAESSGQYSGNLIANDFNLRGILNRFNILTELEDKSALTRINIQSPVSFSQSSLKLENIKASIDETSISGSVDANLGEKPNYEFSISIGDLNADRYIPASSESQSTTSTKTVAAPVAIPVELFNKTLAKGDVHFDKLLIGGAQFSDFNIGVTSANGKLTISPLKSNFFNGEMNGNLAIDSAGNAPALDFDYSLSNVALEPALSSLGVTDKLAGDGNFDLKMAAAGKTDKAMTSSLKGASSLSINNGAIKGINLQDILFKGYQAYATLKDKTVKSKYNPADQTEFSSLSGNWVINNGIISGNDLQMQAPLFRVDGKGQISLINNTIDYLLNVKVVKSLEGQGGKSMKDLEGRTIPLSITGSLTDPEYRLDLSALIKAEARKKAEEKIQEKIEDELGEKLEGEGTLQEKLQKKAVEKAGEKLLDLFNKF